MASIEGQRGQPRPRPPYPAEFGLWGYPTLINNVETLANIPAIVRNGGEWFASIGTEKSKGTKVFALAGRIQQHRPDRSTDGYHAARYRRDDRRRRPGRAYLQGRADRRTFRRLPARAASRPAGRLRHAARSRFDHGIRRHDRDGRDVVDGRCRPVLHGILHGRVVRQVCAVPRRARTRCTDCWTRSPRARRPPRIWRCWKSCAKWCRPPVCAAWARRHPIRCSARCGTSATSTKRNWYARTRWVRPVPRRPRQKGRAQS